VFVIAKTGVGAGRRYRPIAAFHWQFLYGTNVARFANRFLQAVRNPINSLLIQADFKTYRDYDGEYMTNRFDKCEPYLPCPYIDMLYRIATDLDHGDNGSCGFQEADNDLSTCGEYHEAVDVWGLRKNSQSMIQGSQYLT